MSGKKPTLTAAERYWKRVKPPTACFMAPVRMSEAKIAAMVKSAYTAGFKAGLKKAWTEACLSDDALGAGVTDDD